MDNHRKPFQQSTFNNEEWLLSNGFETINTGISTDSKDTASDYIVKILRERLGIRKEIDDRIIIGRIILYLCNTRTLHYYKEIPYRDEAEDFIVVYSDFFMDNLYLVEEFDDRPLDQYFHLTYWAHVEEVDAAGNVYVSSKTVGNKKAYKHKVNNDLILDSFCNNRESFVYINIYTIKQFFLNMLQLEH